VLETASTTVSREEGLGPQTSDWEDTVIAVGGIQAHRCREQGGGAALRSSCVQSRRSSNGPKWPAVQGCAAEVDEGGGPATAERVSRDEVTLSVNLAKPLLKLLCPKEVGRLSGLQNPPLDELGGRAPEGFCSALGLGDGETVGSDGVGTDASGLEDS